MKVKMKSIIVSIITIITCSLIVSAIFTYITKLDTGNVKINSPTIEIVDNDQKSISKLSWKNSLDEVVEVFNTNETYHLDTFYITNTSDTNIYLEFSISSSNIDNLDEYLVLTVSGGGFLIKGGTSEINVSITLKEGIDNSLQGTSIEDLTINISSKEDFSSD